MFKLPNYQIVPGDLKKRIGKTQGSKTLRQGFGERGKMKRETRARRVRNEKKAQKAGRKDRSR